MIAKELFNDSKRIKKAYQLFSMFHYTSIQNYGQKVMVKI